MDHPSKSGQIRKRLSSTITRVKTKTKRISKPSCNIEQNNSISHHQKPPYHRQFSLPFKWYSPCFCRCYYRLSIDFSLRIDSMVFNNSFYWYLHNPNGSRSLYSISSLQNTSSRKMERTENFAMFVHNWHLEQKYWRSIEPFTDRYKR